MSDNTDKNAQFRQELDKKLKEIRELLFEWMKGWEEEKRRIFLFFAAISIAGTMLFWGWFLHNRTGFADFLSNVFLNIGTDIISAAIIFFVVDFSLRRWLK